MVDGRWSLVTEGTQLGGLGPEYLGVGCRFCTLDEKHGRRWLFRIIPL